MTTTADFLGGHFTIGTQHADAPEEQDTPAASAQPQPILPSPQGSQTSRGQMSRDTQVEPASAADSPDGHRPDDGQRLTAVGGQTPQVPAIGSAKPRKPSQGLADPLLALLADILDDLEQTRIANENRLRQLTRDVPDEDGIMRGLGLPEHQADVMRTKALVEGLAALEHQAELNLKRQLRAHPLGAWVKATVGVGEKQGARLLAAIGDPYWNTLHDRPRTVSELWAYAGYRVIELPAAGHTVIEAQETHSGGGGTTSTVGHRKYETHDVLADGVAKIHFSQSTPATQPLCAGVAKLGDPDQGDGESPIRLVGVAQTRARGQRANWSATAKMRAFLVAGSCIKSAHSPYRRVYDDARDKYADAVHRAPCRRCGPAGKPAEVGTPISAGHQHARALRAVAKEILRDLWIQARAIHQMHNDAQ